MYHSLKRKKKEEAGEKGSENNNFTLLYWAIKKLTKRGCGQYF
jgi:hypothetical protein